MLYKLALPEYQSVRTLLAPLDYNLSLLSLLDGNTPGQIFTDHPSQPASALVNLGHHLFFAGSAGNPAFNASIQDLLQKIILPMAKSAGKDVFIIHYDQDAWQPATAEIFAGMYPLERTREYFECMHLVQDWRTLIQGKFTMHPVSTKLISQTQLNHMDYLRDELCSERPTIEDFLEKSFGFALQHDDDLASWCLSEYNTAERCEVGVATVDEYQKRGLATITSLALVEHALTHGYTRVGWHCWKWNAASSALARKSGFTHLRDYPVFLIILNLGVQLALHGYDEQTAGNYPAALAWYQKAITNAGRPPWTYFNTARCLARLDQPEAALDALRQAIEHGFDDFEAIRSHPDLESVHGISGWDTIVTTETVGSQPT